MTGEHPLLAGTDKANRRSLSSLQVVRHCGFVDHTDDDPQERHDPPLEADKQNNETFRCVHAQSLRGGLPGLTRQDMSLAVRMMMRFPSLSVFDDSLNSHALASTSQSCQEELNALHQRPKFTLAEKYGQVRLALGSGT